MRQIRERGWVGHGEKIKMWHEKEDSGDKKIEIWENTQMGEYENSWIHDGDLEHY